MADESDDIESGRPTSDQAATGFALNAAGNAEEARVYLREQIELVRLQKQSLVEQNAFELSHLRWRRFNDQMKGAMQIMAVALGLLVVIGIGAALWNASEAQGIVVESFSVPQDLAAQGMDGEALAADFTQKITAINDRANSVSLALSEADAEDRARDAKVEIPETGISLAEVWRYLKLWLGHERHLSGSVRPLADGKIALTASLGGTETFAFTGAPGELDALEQKAAERIFASVDPHNYVLYLNSQNRDAETLAAARRLIDISTNPKIFAEGYSLYGNITRNITHDARASLALARTSLRLDPTGTPQHMEVLNSSRWLGHDEDVLAQARIIPTLRLEDNVSEWQVGRGVPYVRELGARWLALETGDYNELARQDCPNLCSHSGAVLQRALAAALLHDGKRATALVAEAREYDDVDPGDVAHVRYFIAATAGDWAEAAGEAGRYGDAWRALKYDQLAQAQAVPLEAEALARSGDFASAHRAIDSSALDCYFCLRARGVVAMLEKNWNAAADWFARAVRAAPSVPHAYADWGAMLMAKGDLDGAFDKFALANQKGPHYADPLEMWGEALILKNRSDLALAKFEEAAKYAPNWGRLHLKWGEALWWSGNKDEAKKQFAVAAGLDMTPAEKSELTKVQGMHG
jgi:tetratricopeptide (TPR) repeat protein